MRAYGLSLREIMELTPRTAARLLYYAPRLLNPLGAAGPGMRG